MQNETPNDFETRLLMELRETNIRLEAYQKGLDGMVRMATTIIITTGAAVIFAPLIKEIAPAVASLIKP